MIVGTGAELLKFGVSATINVVNLQSSYVRETAPNALPSKRIENFIFERLEIVSSRLIAFWRPKICKLTGIFAGFTGGLPTCFG